MKASRKRLTNQGVKRLYEMGLAIHWLQPSSKRPVEMKWSKGERKTWKELEQSYRRGMNVGVRLGSPSKIGKGYLAVIDCDVKSEQKAHLKEMEARLKELHEGSGPVVSSGRGNGSRHIYILTPEPVHAQRLAQSSEKIRVLMPSAQEPSKAEKAMLSEKELARGYRLRAAWEISLMGEGQQVVLPPSLHPDTGAEYVWTTPLLGPDSLPCQIFTQEGRGQTDLSARVDGDFSPVEVDLLSSSLPSSVVDQIMTGEGVSDRSSALLGVTNKMLKCRFKETEILSVLTDPDYYLGQVAYEHTKSDSRAKAAEWVRRYTLEKSKRETSAAQVFDDGVIVDDAPKLSEEQVKKQLKSLVSELTWQDKIERTSPENGFRPKNTLKNVILILKGEGGDDVFKRDEFANADLYGRSAPWGSKKGAEVSDLDTVRIKTWLADHYRFEPSDDRINQAIASVADENRYHPVRDYLDRLAWDGVARLDSWLRDYLEAKAPEPYLSAISVKILVAMVKRIYEPGCKFDQIMILEGVQGVGKSTAIRKLAGDQWFSDATINVADKDSVMTMRSIWVMEQGELSGMSKADVGQYKEFIARTTDRIRVPYGRRTENFPRQCIFIGTTNSKEYLKDLTGNRRFWPVSVGKCDFEAIERDRDQLLAEAKVAYELGESLYLEDKEANDVAILEQAARTVHDTWEDMILDWIAKGGADDTLTPQVDRNLFKMEDLFEDAGPLAGNKQNPTELRRAGEILRKIGFDGVVKWDKSTQRVRRMWKKRS